MTRFFLVALLATAAMSPARAASSYESCTGFIDSIPATITTQGTWCLRRDLSSALDSGNMVTVATNNVTIDCNGFKIGGLAAGPATSTNGIYAYRRLNATVRDCNLRGFGTGILLQSSDGALLEHNRLDAVTARAIYVVGDGGMIRGNRIFDTGGTPLQVWAVAIILSGSGTIMDNDIDGVSHDHAFGIQLSSGTGSTLARNRIRNLAGTTSATAIHASGSGGAVIEENTIHGPATEGIRCQSGQALTVRNILSRTTTAVSECQGAGNIVQVPPG